VSTFVNIRDENYLLLNHLALSELASTSTTSVKNLYNISSNKMKVGSKDPRYYLIIGC
jgi:hypothetical protein